MNLPRKDSQTRVSAMMCPWSLLPGPSLKPVRAGEVSSSSASLKSDWEFDEETS